LKPAQVEPATALEPGTVVQVAYRQLPERESVAVLEAVVVRIGEFEGEPVYEIRCLDGQGLQKGDSGGGVWRDGRLVGNNWAVLPAQQAVSASGPAAPAAPAEISYTAVLPDF
jgi:hypothetical protein